MTVIAITPDYRGEIRDRVENYHGNQLLFIGWEDHNMFCSPVCVMVQPNQPFSVLLDEIMPTIYAAHPDWEKIDWQRVQWRHSGAAFNPVADKSMQENGLLHKALISFKTPGLTGIENSFS